MKTVCGLDIHKDSVFVCILFADGRKIEKKFGVTTPELAQMRDLMTSHAVVEVAMESTSIYWIPIWRVLEGCFDLKLVNPYFIKQLPGRKSDVKDAQWIATVLQKELIRGSFVPDEKIRALRQYGRYVFKCVRRKVTCEQAIDRQLQRCNIRISNYVSNIGGKAVSKIVDMLIEGETHPEELLKCVHTRTKKKHGTDVLNQALTGYVQQVDIDMLSLYKEELNLINRQIKEALAKMLEICNEHFAEELTLLQTISGIKERSAMMIISEAGHDMLAFQSATMLVGWTGLKPRNDESAGKVKSRKITHGNKFLRVAMTQCAWAATRTKASIFHVKFNRFLSRKMKSQKALIAIARKLLVVVWHVLSQKQAFISTRIA